MEPAPLPCDAFAAGGGQCVASHSTVRALNGVGDDGVVANLQVMPTIYISTTNIGYSPNGTVNSPSIIPRAGYMADRT